MAGLVQEYLSQCDLKTVDAGNLAYLASLEKVAEVSPEIAKSILQELIDQRTNLKMIASENFCSLSTQLAMGNLLTDKYSEGFPFHRFYAGCDNVDTIEDIACKEACSLFGAEHAYVQPHCGADANMVAFWSILRAKVQVPAMEKLGEENPANLSREDWNRLRVQIGEQRLLGMDLYSGGHLTHGYRLNISSHLFDCYHYGVSKETGLLDYDALEKQVNEVKPLILLAGYSAYPRAINFARLRKMADAVGAVLMVDMAHFAGLVAGGVFEGDFNPVAHAQVVTSTTHKTLRGPRGGIVLCTEEFAESVDKGCPMVMGGPLPHVMAAKAVAFKEANTPEFKAYAKKIVTNANALAQAMMQEGITVLSGGTDNHLLLIDVRPFGLNGRQAESVMRECEITLNRNALPYDTNGPWYTSGLRVGTPALTTLGMGENEMKEIASIFKLVLSNTQPALIESGKNAGQTSKAKYVIADEVKNEVKRRVQSLLNAFVLYPELDVDLMKKHLF
ncbi:MAG: glycine hydroxymethyltransferase [bacterium]|nr:glycine hydroxymethyltransferase [bacterium]